MAVTDAMVKAFRSSFGDSMLLPDQDHRVRKAVAAALHTEQPAVEAETERCLSIIREWLTLFGEKEPKYISAKTWAGDALHDIEDAIRSREPNHD